MDLLVLADELEPAAKAIKRVAEELPKAAHEVAPKIMPAADSYVSRLQLIFFLGFVLLALVLVKQPVDDQSTSIECSTVSSSAGSAWHCLLMASIMSLLSCYKTTAVYQLTSVVWGGVFYIPEKQLLKNREILVSLSVQSIFWQKSGLSGFDCCIYCIAASTASI